MPGPGRVRGLRRGLHGLLGGHDRVLRRLRPGLPPAVLPRHGHSGGRLVLQQVRTSKLSQWVEKSLSRRVSSVPGSSSVQRHVSTLTVRAPDPHRHFILYRLKYSDAKSI